MREISLYIHVPFCKRRCSYCTFYHVPHIEAYERRFVDALIAELDQTSADIGEPFVIPTVFFGGGTPSVLSRASLERIVASFVPRLDKRAEVTFETNPEDVTPDLLVTLRGLGVNRLSLGVQSMVPRALNVLKRCDSDANARAIAEVAKRFDNFSLDVLLGVPGGTLGELATTLDSLIPHAPAHFSVYCLEPGGVMHSEVAAFFDGVDPDRSADEYLLTCERLRSTGYVRYEVSNFARPGFECRHNRVYWGGGEYLGIGPAAHSFLAGERFSNEPSIERYAATNRPAGLRRADRRRRESAELEAVMLALRTGDGIALDQLSCPEAVVENLVAGNYARVRTGRLQLTDTGFLLLNEIVLRVGSRGASRLAARG